MRGRVRGAARSNVTKGSNMLTACSSRPARNSDSGPSMLFPDERHARIRCTFISDMPGIERSASADAVSNRIFRCVAYSIVSCSEAEFSNPSSSTSSVVSMTVAVSVVSAGGFAVCIIHASRIAVFMLHQE